MTKKLPKLRTHIGWKEGVNEESQTCEVLQLDFYNNEITVLTIDPEDGFESHWHVSLDGEYAEVTILWGEFFKQLTAVDLSSVDSQPAAVDAASSEHSE